MRLCLIISSPRKLIGVRDPFGLRPLCLGKKGNVWIMASESCAITSVGGEFIRDIEPGEIVTITRDGVFLIKACSRKNGRTAFSNTSILPASTATSMM